MTAPTALPVNTGRVEGWPMPCLPIALTSSIESSTSVGSSGCCRAIVLSLIDGEAFAQSADAAPDIRLDVGVAMFALVAQGFEHVGDHIADFLELGAAEAARRRSEERRVGKEGCRTVRSRWLGEHKKKKNKNNEI